MRAIRTIVSRIRQSSAIAHEQSQALIEYALILSVVAMAAIATLTLTGQSASAMIDKIANAPTAQQTTQPGTTTTTTTTTTSKPKKPKKPKG
jgi:Flp pilus assembly pilin Flp